MRHRVQKVVGKVVGERAEDMAKQRGVSLTQTNRDGWVAKWADPITGRRRQQSLSKLGLNSSRARERWARQKIQELERTKQLTEKAAEAQSIQDALLKFHASYRDARPRTRDAYQFNERWVREWSKLRRIEWVQEITPSHVGQLREWIVDQPKWKPATGKGRGAKVISGRPSPVSTNTRLRTTRTILETWRRWGLLPQVTRDDLADRMRLVPITHTQPEIVRPDQLREILTYLDGRDTRDFAAFVLLSGVRLSEALTLRWDHVHLDAPPAGEFIVDAALCKTRRERTVDLSVSPALRRLLLRRRKAEGGEWVFGGVTPWQRGKVDGSRIYSIRRGAPHWNWQKLRRTCGTYLVCTPGIWGGAGVYRAARQLGHSIAVAERHYLGVVRSIPLEVDSLEAALGLADLLD